LNRTLKYFALPEFITLYWEALTICWRYRLLIYLTDLVQIISIPFLMEFKINTTARLSD